MDEKSCVTFLLCDPGWYVQRTWCPERMGRKHNMDQPGKVDNPARGQLNRENSAVPSRVSLLISILRLNMVLTGFLPSSAATSVYLFKPPYAIGSVPSLSGHAIAYRWRSLTRVRRHRVSKPQGSSERVLPWQVAIDQLICASLSHTHYWYEVGMLKVPAYSAFINRFGGFIIIW